MMKLAHLYSLNFFFKLLFLVCPYLTRFIYISKLKTNYQYWIIQLNVQNKTTNSSNIFLKNYNFFEIKKPHQSLDHEL